MEAKREEEEKLKGEEESMNYGTHAKNEWRKIIAFIWSLKSTYLGFSGMNMNNPFSGIF